MASVNNSTTIKLSPTQTRILARLANRTEVVYIHDFSGKCRWAADSDYVRELCEPVNKASVDSLLDADLLEADRPIYRYRGNDTWLVFTISDKGIAALKGGK